MEIIKIVKENKMLLWLKPVVTSASLSRSAQPCTAGDYNF